MMEWVGSGSMDQIKSVDQRSRAKSTALSRTHQQQTANSKQQTANKSNRPTTQIYTQTQGQEEGEVEEGREEKGLNATNQAEGASDRETCRLLRLLAL